jgi:hypothetical protein
MIRAPAWLLQHRKDIYSQTGEDGILDKIFDVIPPASRPWCVEFGAWDGLHLTNTRHLIQSRGFSAVLIEADQRRFRSLRRNYADCANVTTLNARVGFTPSDSLDRILESTPVPKEFDLLSVDIDGNDYHAWKAVTQYRPRVVVIEFNPTIPDPVHFVQPADIAINQGASLLALVEMAKEKGYELICVLPFNAFFVRQEDYARFGLTANDPQVLRTDRRQVTYLFSGYDGRVFLQGSCRLPWHRIRLNESDMQLLPRSLRQYPETYSMLQHLALLWLRSRRWFEQRINPSRHPPRK